jgi:HNH endonuclease
MTVNQNSSLWTEITCKRCGKKRVVRKVYVERGQMKHCSRDCFHRAKRTRTLELVEYRGQLFYINSYGYYVSLKTKRSLNRLVWETHYGPIPPGHKVYLKDRNRSNYHVENLYLKKMKPEGECDEEGCQDRIHARGKCKSHYWKMRDRERHRLPGCSGYSQVSEKNRILFDSEKEAEAAGYIRDGNCPK